MNFRRKSEARRAARGDAALDALASRPAVWMPRVDAGGVVISTRVRLARNLRHRCFPEWAEDRERRETCAEICEALAEAPSFRESWFLNLEHLRPLDEELLVERRLMSRDMLAARPGRGLIVSRDEHVSLMINEEDHLRLQVLRAKLALPEAFKQADGLDDELASRLDFAFSGRLGYLTACPSNVGTGLRVSVMVHLPALCLLREVDGVIKGLECLGLLVRGLLGEGTEARGNLFQISNGSSLGETEEQIVDRLGSRVNAVVQHEQNARARLWEERRRYLTDQIGRALGLLTHARLLSSPEATDLLSGVRLGVEMGLVEGITVGDLNEMMFLTQAAHLQKIAGVVCRAEERDERRADWIRARLRTAALKD